MLSKHLLPIAMMLAAAAPALASDQPGTTADQWTEEHTSPDNTYGNPDAGPLPSNANITRGAGPLNRITGQFVRTDDADMYAIFIANPSAFSATTAVSGNSADTNLSLFTTTGVALTFNDNTPGTSSARSTITGVNIPGPGLYMLAVSRNDIGFGSANYTRPLDSLGNLIFPGPAYGTSLANNDPMRSTEFAPITAGTVLAGWEVTNGFQAFNATYVVSLTGAGYNVLPAPGAAALLGLGGLVGLRRRR